jgi:integrase
MRELLLSLPRSLDPAAPVLPPRSPEALTNAFGHLVRRLGIKDLRFHDLRHDVASTLTQANVPQRVIMAMLGHRRPEMTVRYQHVDPSYLRQAAQALDRVPTGTITAPAGSESA